MKVLGLYASGAQTKSLPETAKRQLVLDEIVKDPLGKLGHKLYRTILEMRQGYI